MKSFLNILKKLFHVHKHNIYISSHLCNDDKHFISSTMMCKCGHEKSYYSCGLSSNKSKKIIIDIETNGIAN